MKLVESNNPAEIKLETIWRTVLVTDARNSSQAYFSERADEALVRIERDRAIFAQIAHDWSGEEVRDRGDGSMFAFCDPIAALRAAMAMQEEIARYNDSLPQETLRIAHRMGIHMGEIKLVTSRYRVSGNESFRRKLSGEIVVTATRLEAICHPGEVCFSNDVYKAIRGKIDHEFRFLDATMKGFDRPVRSWSTRMNKDWSRPVTAEEEQRKKKQAEELRLREKWEREQRETRRWRGVVKAATVAAVAGVLYSIFRVVQMDGTIGPRFDRAWTAFVAPQPTAKDVERALAREAAPKSAKPSKVAHSDPPEPNTPPSVPPVLSAEPAREKPERPGVDRHLVAQEISDGLRTASYATIADQVQSLGASNQEVQTIAKDAARLTQMQEWLGQRFEPDDGENQVRVTMLKPVRRMVALTGASRDQIQGEDASGNEVSVGLGDLSPNELFVVLSMVNPRVGKSLPHPPAVYVQSLTRLRNRTTLGRQ